MFKNPAASGLAGARGRGGELEGRTMNKRGQAYIFHFRCNGSIKCLKGRKFTPTTRREAFKAGPGLGPEDLD